MIDIAISIKISGTPSARKPDSNVFHSVERLDCITIGINNGAKNPETKTIPPIVIRVRDIAKSISVIIEDGHAVNVPHVFKLR